MNHTTLIGNLTADPIVHIYGEEPNTKKAVKYTLAVDRIKGKETDFIPCICFNKPAEFAEMYLCKGMQIGVYGQLQSGNYVNKEGHKIFTLELNVKEHYFADSKVKKEEKIITGGFMEAPTEGEF